MEKGGPFGKPQKALLRTLLRRKEAKKEYPLIRAPIIVRTPRRRPNEEFQKKLRGVPKKELEIGIG